MGRRRMWFPCEQCGKKFRQESSKKKHEYAAHVRYAKHGNGGPSEKEVPSKKIVAEWVVKGTDNHNLTLSERMEQVKDLVTKVADAFESLEIVMETTSKNLISVSEELAKLEQSIG